MHCIYDIKTKQNIRSSENVFAKKIKYLKVLAVPFYIVFFKTYQNCYDICSLSPLQAIDIIEWFFKC